MKKIIVSLSNDVTNDQRVLRIAGSLKRLEYKVILVGRVLPQSDSVSTVPFKVKRFRMIFRKGFLFYFFFNLRLFCYLLFQRADSLLSNDLDTLLPNFLVSKLKNIRLVYDSHEYFTEVPELIERKRVYRVWLNIEKFIFPRLQSVYTVSNSIAKAYQKKYSVPVGVIRNLPLRKIPGESDYQIKGLQDRKVILYQGTLNQGRGIDLAIRAMEFIEGAALVIAGDGPERLALEEIAQNPLYNQKVIFLGKLSPEKLKKITCQASLGLSIEQNMGLNYYYALPNKLFDYIASEVPVLVSPFPEMEKIVQEFGVGEILDSFDPKYLAQTINKMLCDTSKQAFWKKNLKEAAKKLCWEEEEKLLQDFF